MTNYVLVHGGNMSTGTWNKLAKGVPVETADGKMGGKVWAPLFPLLQAHGHQVFAPTLGDERTSDLSGHIAQVCALIAGHDLGDIVLAGHSYGGMVVTGIAAKMAARIRRLVYVDAAVPDPGRSLFDIIKSSGCDPLSFAGLEADPPYVEKLEFDPQIIKALPKIYIRCTRSDFAVVTNAAKKKIEAEKDNWAYFEIPSSHVPMAEAPEELARLLLAAAG